jgi:hypothetical protein
VDYGKVKAYMVLDIGTTEKLVQDGQSADIVGSELIIYDRYKGPKSYLEDNPDIVLTLTPEPVEKLAAIQIYGEGYQVNVVGKLKMTDVGLDKKVNVPQDLAGSMLMRGSFFDESDIIGAITVTGTLEKTLTKLANKDETDVESTSAAIIAGLEKKGFTNLD